MNGDDGSRPRRLNAKPFRETAPAWLPAFQAPANLLQHRLADAHTSSANTKHSTERTNEGKGSKTGNSESERNEMRMDRVHHAFSLLS